MDPRWLDAILSILIPVWIGGIVIFAIHEVFFTGDDDELGE
jgi:hypothetical protein